VYSDVCCIVPIIEIVPSYIDTVPFNSNIAQWFENWENNLVELGLADRDPTTEKVTIFEEQLGNIVNLDETAISLDGSTQNKGGRPEAILLDPRFPMVGRMTSKSSLSTTLIC
jgi:hypothetical protein